MGELSLEQKRAIAVAQARLRLQQNGGILSEEGDARANLRALGGSLPEPEPESDTYRGLVVPYEMNEKTGDWKFAVPRLVEDVYNAAKSAVTAPGRALSGELQVTGPDGRTSPEAIAEAANVSAMASPMTPGLRAGEAIVPGAQRALKPARVEPPTMEALKAASRDGYESLRGMDAQYSSQSISDMAAGLERTLAQQGLNEKTAPKTIQSLRELQRPPEGGFASSSDVETIRRTFGAIGEDFANPTDRNAGKFVRGAIDSFLDQPPAGSVLPGSETAAARAGELAREARGNYAAGKRAERLSGIRESAENRAAASNSGQNVGNTLRQRAASIVASPKLSSGFTENELAAIRQVARGTTGQNLTRYVGNLLGGGGGLGAAFTGTAAGAGVAAATGNPLMAAAGVAAPLVGAGSKQLSNIMTERAWKAVDEATRKRSPLYQEMQRNAPLVPDEPVIAPSFFRTLLMSGTAPKGR